MAKAAPVVTIPDPYVYKGFMGTWCGRPGTSTEVAMNMNAIRKHGRRIIIHRWSDDHSGYVKLIHGDGRTKAVIKYAEVNVSPGGDFNAPLRALLTLL